MKKAIIAARRAEFAPVGALRNNLIGATAAAGYLKAQPTALRGETKRSAVGIEMALEVVGGYFAK